MQDKRPSKRKTPACEAEKSTFATNLRECMEARGRTQSWLAKEIGVKRQTVSLYMNGQSSPNVETLLEIANALEVSTDYLLGLSVVPLVDEDLQSAHEYTGLSPTALQNISAWRGSCQVIGHTIYNPVLMLSRLCENDQFRMFLFDLLAAWHYKHPPIYSHEAFMSEMEFHLDDKKGALLRSFTTDELIDLVAPLNERFGVVALDEDETAKHYLSSACDRLKKDFFDMMENEQKCGEAENRDKTETGTKKPIPTSHDKRK